MCPQVQGSEKGLDDFGKNFSRDEEINLQRTEKQPGNQEVERVNGNFCCYSRNSYEKKVNNRAGTKGER